MIRRSAMVLGIVLAVGVAVVMVRPASRAWVVGRARGETFHRGMPLSYWLDALEGNDSNLRYEALLAVGRDRNAIPALTGRLKDEIPLLRHMAAVELARFGPKAREAVPALTEMLKDPDRSCRQAATDALQAITGAAAPAGP